MPLEQREAHVELRALAGATIPLVDPSYKPDAAIAAVTDGTTQPPDSVQSTFPYLGTPYDGFDNPLS